MGNIKCAAQFIDKFIIFTDGFAGAVRELGNRFTVAFHQLDNNIERLDIRDIAGQAGADTEHQIYPVTEMGIKREGFAEIQVI